MCNLSVANIGCDLYIQQFSQFSKEEEQIKNNVHFWIDGVMNTSIAIAGIIINTIIIFILRTKIDLKHVSTGLFCGLLIADNLYLAVKVISNCYWNFDIHQLAYIMPHLVYPMEKTFSIKKHIRDIFPPIEFPVSFRTKNNFPRRKIRM